MDFHISVTTASTKTGDIVIFPIYEGQTKLSTLPASVQQFLAQSQKNNSFSGKSGEAIVFPSLGATRASLVGFVGLGSRSAFSIHAARESFGTLVRHADLHKCQSVVVDTENIDASRMPDFCRGLTEGLELGRFDYKDYDKKSVFTVTVTLPRKTTRKALYLDQLNKGQIIGSSTNIARKLANTPANLLCPEDVVAFCKAHFKKTAVTCKVIDKKEAEKLGMHSFLSVGQGSDQPSYMLVMEYLPIKNAAPLALVGKGITFDSGGISIKPSLNMGAMKGDMGGAAAVIGAMSAISKFLPNKNVIAITPLAENLPSGHALKPGDVITAMNGKTIEVLNTDAEGRLVLADALCYAVEQRASQIIDIATLTGASTIALGDSAMAILGNNTRMINTFKKNEKVTGERVWQLPLYDDYLDLLKSKVADLANVNEGRTAGTALAAKFLEQFVSGTPWAHLDIACVMQNKSTKGSKVEGMSGAGTRNLIEYVLTTSDTVKGARS